MVQNHNEVSHLENSVFSRGKASPIVWLILYDQNYKLYFVRLSSKAPFVIFMWFLTQISGEIFEIFL